MTGARVLDVGAGTGVAARAAIAAGAARVVAVDIADGMLRRGGGLHAVLADACALPFPPASFDLVLAACCLGHLPDPAAALRAARRVGAAIVASAFEAGWTHPAKAAVDDALGRFGFRRPQWYEDLKRDTEPQVDDPKGLADLASAAGYRDVRADVIRVPTGLGSAAQLANWRLGMAHLAPFLQALSPAERAEARHAAEAALVDAPPLVVQLIVLVAS